MGKFDTAYTVERTIEDVEFTENKVQEIRNNIKSDLFEKHGKVPQKMLEERLHDKLEKMARDKTLNAQGHNDLYYAISVGGVVDGDDE